MKADGTRGDRAVKLTQLIEILNPVIERHVDANDVDAYVSAVEPVPLEGVEPRLRQTKPDFAARLKALSRRVPVGELVSDAQCLIDCRVAWAHQAAISRKDLTHAFEAAVRICQYLEESAAVRAVDDLRLLTPVSQWHERETRQQAKIDTLARKLDSQRRTQGSFAGLFGSMTQLAQSRLQVWIRTHREAWRDAQQHPAGPVSRDRRVTKHDERTREPAVLPNPKERLRYWQQRAA